MPSGDLHRNSITQRIMTSAKSHSTKMWNISQSHASQEGLCTQPQSVRNSSTVALNSVRKQISDLRFSSDSTVNERLISEQISSRKRIFNRVPVKETESISTRASSAPFSDRRKLESDLEVVIGSNQAAVGRPRTAFDKYKTRSEAKLLLSQSHPRYYVQQAIRRRLSNQERWKNNEARKETSQARKKEFISFLKRDKDLFMVTKLQAPNKSTIDGVSKLLSKYNLIGNDQLLDENECEISSSEDTNLEKNELNSNVRIFCGTPVDSGTCSELTGETIVSEGSVSFSESIDTQRGVESDISLSGVKLDNTAVLNNETLTDSQASDDCSNCLVCTIERIVDSFLYGTPNDFLVNEDDVAVITQRICQKINDEMSVPEEVANDLEIHIRRLLAARKLDQRPIKSQNDSKGTLNVHSEESKPKKMVTDDGVVKEETIGILYAENKFEKFSRRDSVQKMSLSGSPINMSSNRLKNGYNHNKAIVVNSGTQPPKTEKSFRFSYTHAQKSGSNVAEPSILSNSDRDTKTLKEGASNFRISLNIYKNKQNIEKRHRVEEAKTFKACLHPRVVVTEKSPLRSEYSRYRDNRHMPSRLGDWYWKRLEEIERHRCPPPPNSPVPREWNEADM